MKTIGLIGGMSWESSQEYYRILNEVVKKRLGGLHSAQCILYSVDFHEIEQMQREDKWMDLSNLMVKAALDLKAAGADFIVICANTMHRVAEEIERESGLKVLHIVDAVGEKIQQQGLKRVGFLGTRYTMEGDFYMRRLLEKYRIEVLIPGKEDRELVNDVIYQELCVGKREEESKKRLLDLCGKLMHMGAQGIILGCTELPLLISQEDMVIPIFDTTEIHAYDAVDWALESYVDQQTDQNNPQNM